MPAAVLCQAPRRWGRSYLDPVAPTTASPSSFTQTLWGGKLRRAKPASKTSAGRKDFQRNAKATTKNKGCTETMSSEQESYTLNICHQTQGPTIYIVPLWHSVIPSDWPPETAVILWGLQISCLPKWFVVSYAGHKSSSPRGRTRTSVQMKQLNREHFKAQQSQEQIAFRLPFPPELHFNNYYGLYNWWHP